jgi:hypothetical protein
VGEGFENFGHRSVPCLFLFRKVHRLAGLRPAEEDLATKKGI